MARHSSLPEVDSAPDDLYDLLAADRGDTCVPCKILGASAFMTLGAYSYFSGRHQLRRQQAAILSSGSRFGIKSRQMAISAIASALVGMGVWRLVR
ncbi:MAG: hypothetical protein M1826_006422 [Phylliscum demangeonii]|nr:MAG: hypothetical protein M1826_006422 [Phylliscum demangeonii]